MTRAEPGRSGRCRLPREVLLLALLACIPQAGCSGSAGQPADDPDAHGLEEVEHGDEHGPPADDAHHASLHDGECEDDVRLTPAAIVSAGIRVEPARRVVLAGQVRAPARVSLRAESVARIGSPLYGRVVELPVKLGDRVEKDQLLLVAECPDFGQTQAEYLQRRAEAAALEPLVDLARSAHQRAQGLLDSIQGITLTEVQKRDAEARAAERDLAIARAAATAAANRLALYGFDATALATLEREQRVASRIELRAPFGGQIMARNVTLGELVGPDKDDLLVLADTSRLWILAHVPESRLGDVRPGASVRVSVTALGLSDLFGTVAAIAPMLDVETRNAEVRIEVENADGRLLPGMFAQAAILAARPGTAAVLGVPDGAVQTVAGEPSVFIAVDEDGLVFCRHTITAATQVEDTIPVLGGLDEGALVAVSGTFVLKAEFGRSAAAEAHDH